MIRKAWSPAQRGILHIVAEREEVCLGCVGAAGEGGCGGLGTLGGRLSSCWGRWKWSIMKVLGTLGEGTRELCMRVGCGGIGGCCEGVEMCRVL